MLTDFSVTGLVAGEEGKMKFLDEQGRVFGKRNIIDLLVEGFIILIISAGIVGVWIITHSFPKTESFGLPSRNWKEEYQVLYQDIYDFLKEHKRARKYFDIEWD